MKRSAGSMVCHGVHVSEPSLLRGSDVAVEDMAVYRNLQSIPGTTTGQNKSINYPSYMLAVKTWANIDSK